MDLHATFPGPVKAVFGHLSDPARLSDWLAEVTVAATDPALAGATGADFPLTAQIDGIQVAGSGEMTAFEPPWLVSYRLFIGTRTHGLRITCSTQFGGTRIHIHQSDDTTPLIIDLPRLTRALGAPAG